jgi:Ca-activated chloride channel family protein
MKKTHVASGRARAAASVLTLSFVAVVTGAVPVAGLAFQPRPGPEPAATEVVCPPEAFVTVGAPDPAEPLGPADPSGRPADRVQVGPVQLAATLGQATLLRSGAEQVVDLVVAVDVARPETTIERRPVDLALVVDTSASMSGVIGLVKRATLGVIERLGDGDRLVLVGYADEARVLFQGPVTPASRAQLEGVVGRLVAARGTNISAGLEVGRLALSALERPAEQKLLLLSDGAPTIGATEPRELEAGAAAVRKGGVTLSAIGLGPSYREGLLASMADAGGGAFHHVERPDALPRVYAAELDLLRAVALRDARLSIRPAPGVVVERVAAWTARDAAGASVVALGDLSFGGALKVVVRLRVAPGAAATCEVASVRLEGELEQGAALALETAGLSASVTDDAAAAEASRVAAVEGDLRQADVADCLRRAHEAAERRDGDQARALVREARALCGSDALTFTAPTGEEQRVNLDALADELAEGATTDRGQRAMKTTVAAERGAGRAR